MKELWVEVRPWKKELATTAIESGADVLVVDDPAKVRELGRVTTVAAKGDLVPGKDVFEVEVKDRPSEEEAVRRSKEGYVIVRTPDWTVIPLENLVSRADRVIAAVKDRKEAELALGALERGVRGILLKPANPSVIRDVAKVVRETSGQADLVPFTVTAVRPVGMGDRVCVDTCTMMGEGQGILVGNTSSAFLLVQAETQENPYVAPRPFRVNAGAVHAYALMPGGKTAYLSEIDISSRVALVSADGKVTEACVGRTKIEKRPLLLVEAEGAGGERASLILQNAETVRLVGVDGKPVSVAALKVGDRVLGATAEAGRHFGVAVKESIVEK
ncbi:MAG TPA: 3-dehydroquinate synthase II [Methanomicrobiales archaeon]|nr:3-dehydroquinate synthase II [Methanomicrobiales archaeon]